LTDGAAHSTTFAVDLKEVMQRLCQPLFNPDKPF
jgi:hypothetical protein